MRGSFDKVYGFLGRHYDLFRNISTPVSLVSGFVFGTCIRLQQWLGVWLSGVVIVLWFITMILSVKSHRGDILFRRHKEKSIAATTLIQRPSWNNNSEDDDEDVQV